MSRYTPYILGAYVYISKDFKRVFFGKRNVYAKKDKKGKTTGFYVRYKNKYYHARYYGRNNYEVYIRQ